MQRNRIVIDCDPGIDDTFALILCIKKLDVAGIVAVGGNTGLQFTSRNARYVTELTGRTDIPVYAGYDQPMLGNAVRAEYVHGVGGLGDLDIPEPKKQLEKEHGVDFLIRTFTNENADERGPGDLEGAGIKKKDPGDPHHGRSCILWKSVPGGGIQYRR